MTNRNQTWNNYGGYQTFYPEGLSYYGEDAYYEYYYHQPPVSYDNFYPPNAYFQQNNNVKVPTLPSQSKPKETVVDKSSLYRKPDIEIPVQNNNSNFRKPVLQNSGKWTDQYWQKQEEDFISPSTPENVQQNTFKPANKIEKTLNEMLAQPVQMSKGKSMLEKMGWTGGGLGKDGDGIVEPIAPKATYASQTMGLGLLTEFNDRSNSPPRSQMNVNQPAKNKGNKKPQFIKKKNKNKQVIQEPIDLELSDDDLQFTNYFRKNLLLKILEFVKNNKKIEIKFDAKLSKFERKRIHQLVEAVRDCEDADDSKLDLDDDEKEVLTDIMAHNNYVLCTESSGKGVNRCLSLFKEAPDLVYITTPHYIREERYKSDTKDFLFPLHIKEPEKSGGSSGKNIKNDITTNKTSNSNVTDNKSATDVIIIDTDNIGNGGNDLKKEVNDNKLIENVKPKPRRQSVLQKIIDFFKEFANEPIYIYEEFRFLGCFNKREAAAVKMFFDICMKIDVECDEANQLLQILEHETHVFTVDFDCNGNLVVFKAERSK